jgi:hypothetical protein
VRSDLLPLAIVGLTESAALRSLDPEQAVVLRVLPHAYRGHALLLAADERGEDWSESVDGRA